MEGYEIFAGIGFESLEDAEVFAIGADGEVQRRAALGGVVEDENDAAIAESYGIEAGVGVGEIEGVNGAPVQAGVGGIGDADFGDLFGGTGVETKGAVFEANDGRLDDAIGAGCCGSWAGRRWGRCESRFAALSVLRSIQTAQE